MAEQCGSGPTVEELEAEFDQDRQERIDRYYPGESAADMAERIVDLEDELGADVDGICTGMHADVAEAHAEIERLNSLVGYWEHRAEESAEEAQRRRNQVENFRGWQGSIYEVARSVFRSAHRSRTEARRYRSAWLSARRRAVDEANFGMEALDRERARHASFVTELQPLVRARMEELRRLRQFKAEDIRESTHVPRLECAGTEEDGGTVYLLVDGSEVR